MSEREPSSDLSNPALESAGPRHGHPSSRGLLPWMRSALAWLTAGYLAGLLVLLLALEWWGERNWLLSVLLYAPAQMVLAPLLILSPLSALWRWRLLGWHLAAVGAVIFGYMTFRWSPLPKPSPSTVTAVTFNYGDSDHAQFLAFLQREKPDFVVLQDSYSHGAEVGRQLPGMQISELGQFALLSRFPIHQAAFVDVGEVKDPATKGKDPVMARWEVTIQGRTVAIYSVRLPTPRRELSQFLRKRRLLAGVVDEVRNQEAFGEYREWISERIALAYGVEGVFASEPYPTIIGGDFNTPDHGFIYHLFAARLTDAFARAGRGWGFSFPGSTPNPVSFYGPWLRIDYFFVGRGWKVIECRPEPGQKSEHKAVVARFEPLVLP